MIVFLTILFLSSLLVKYTLFAPFFFLAYISLFHSSYSLLFAIVFGIIFDMFWVLPGGFAVAIFLLFVILMKLYDAKYNARNQKFLFILCVIFTLFLGFVLQVRHYALSFFLFAVSFLVLSAVVRREIIRENTVLSKSI